MHRDRCSWKRARRAFGKCGHAAREDFVEEGDTGTFSQDFGVRRPLRFLTHKLSLEDAQVLTQAGSIVIRGQGVSDTSSAYHSGVHIASGSLVQTSSGSITIT